MTLSDLCAEYFMFNHTYQLMIEKKYLCLSDYFRGYLQGQITLLYELGKISEFDYDNLSAELTVISS